MSAATTLSLLTGTQACTLCAHPAPGLSPRPRGPLADLLCACQDCRGRGLTRPSPAQGRLQRPAEAPRPGSRLSTSGLTDSSGPLFALFHFRKLPSRSSSLLERVLSAGPGSVKAGEMTVPCSGASECPAGCSGGFSGITKGKGAHTKGHWQCDARALQGTRARAAAGRGVTPRSKLTRGTGRRPHFQPSRSFSLLATGRDALTKIPKEERKSGCDVCRAGGGLGGSPSATTQTRRQFLPGGSSSSTGIRGS